MRIILCFCCSLFLLTVAFPQSPISLGNSNMPGGGDTLRYSNAQLSSLGNYTQTGTNFTWNFSTLNPVSQGVRSFKMAFQTPYAFFFVGINEYGEKIADTLGAGPVTMTNYYNYYRKSSSPSAFLADGVGITFSSVPVPSYYSDKDELYNFPMTYPKYDSTTFKFTTSTNTNIPVKYSKTGYRVTVVDGWGSVTTPYGTDNCLRLVTTQYSKDTVRYNNFPFGWLNYQRSYQWLTTSSKIPFLEITGNLVGSNFTPTMARYRDVARVLTTVNEQDDLSGMVLYPNPVKDAIFMNAPATGKAIIEICDIHGRLLRQETLSGSGISDIDVSTLRSGIYILRLREENNSRCFKFIKE
jgi:hypothetical protein